MEDDFDAETLSVSEDSEDDNEADGDEQLESAIGETGANSEVVDEKMGNKDEDECPNNENEKNESGPPVENEDVGSRELRANDDEHSASGDENGETDVNEQKEQNDEGESNTDPVDGEEAEDMNFDNEQEFAEPPGSKQDESNECPDLDMDMNEKEDASSVQDDLEEDENTTENGNTEENVTDPIDENMTEAETERETSEMDIEGDDHEENNQLNAMAPMNDASEAGENAQNAESATQPNGGLQSSESKNIGVETSWSRSNEIHNDGSSSRSMPTGDASETDILAADSSSGGKFSNDPLNTQLPQHEASSSQKMQPNPYRNVGDALEKWKERARVSVDLQENNADVQEEMEDENAEEYGFVSEMEKGSAQAMGPATSEQIDREANANSSDKDRAAATKSDDSDPMESERQNLEKLALSRTSIHKSTVDDPMHVSNLENPTEEDSQEFHKTEDVDSTHLSDNLVSVNRTYLNESMRKCAKLSVNDDELGKVNNTEIVSNEMKDNATAVWRKYELRTTRLSQELAEQLRLVMEPTLASKLQGDYKTGKRINMKKVQCS